MRNKLLGEQIDLSVSPGFFVDGKLCGFILHGVGQRDDRKIIWNGGTGVVPEQRGQSITTQLYAFILPELRAGGYTRSVLEVIDANSKAIKIYEKVGFETTRSLLCFQGKVAPTGQPENVVLDEVRDIEWECQRRFWSWQPSFQNAEHKIARLRDKIRVVGAFVDKSLIGYIAFANESSSGNIYQFAVDTNFRCQGIGRALFGAASAGKSVPLSVINVDSSHRRSIDFLSNVGLKPTVSQIEMTLEL